MGYLQKKQGTSDEKVASIVEGTYNHVPYVIKPTMIKLFDTVNFPDSPEQVIEFSSNK